MTGLARREQLAPGSAPVGRWRGVIAALVLGAAAVALAADPLPPCRGSAAGAVSACVEERVRRAMSLLRADDARVAFETLQSIGEVDVSPELQSRVDAAWYELQALRVGHEAPPFRARALDGRIVDLLRWRDRVVVLHFWAPDCGDCADTVAALRRLRARYEPDQVRIIGVAVGGTAAERDAWIEAQAADWPQVPAERDGEIVTLFNASDRSRTFVVGPEGVLAARDPSPAELGRSVDAAARRSGPRRR